MKHCHLSLNIWTLYLYIAWHGTGVLTIVKNNGNTLLLYIVCKRLRGFFWRGGKGGLQPRTHRTTGAHQKRHEELSSKNVKPELMKKQVILHELYK